MNIHIKPLLYVLAVLGSLVHATQRSCAEVELIAPFIGNGSFEESDTLSGWQRSNLEYTVTDDEHPGATEGSSFLIVEHNFAKDTKRNTSRLIQRNISSSSGDGKVFELSFDAGTEAEASYRSISATISLHEAAGDLKAISNYQIINQPLGTNGLQPLKGKVIVKDQDWEALSIRIQFTRKRGDREGIRKGYLDNIKLVQREE